MKIAITGSRGIPNNYGGFEQCAENLAVLLVKAGHEVTVYNPDYHEYDKPDYKGVKIVKCKNPEKKIGTAGNFFYDYLCMRHALKQECDILLVLGYTTASVFFPFLKKGKSKLITNMDGLEWLRDKWSTPVKKLAKWFEGLGANYSDLLIADNGEIKNYLLKEYGKDSTMIAYGAEIPKQPDESILKQYDVVSRKYDVLVARLEKENNIETILDGVVKSGTAVPFLVIGKNQTPYGKLLIEKYRNQKNIHFAGGIYILEHLDSLRHYCRFYFHGHSVGGTNPSLLEAMASGALILSHDNLFNRDVLGKNAYYFASSDESSQLLLKAETLEVNRENFVAANLEKIRNEFNWQHIARQYEELFKKAITN
jgi:glycosyltransferase involved in cell wall biosynthesis